MSYFTSNIAYNFLTALAAVGESMATNLTQSDGDVVTNDRAQCASSGIAYCRLSPQLSVEVGLDETDDEIVRLKLIYFDCI